MKRKFLLLPALPLLVSVPTSLGQVIVDDDLFVTGDGTFQSDVILFPDPGNRGDLLMPLGRWNGFRPPAGGPDQGDLTLDQGDLLLFDGDLFMAEGTLTINQGDFLVDIGDVIIGLYDPLFNPVNPGDLLIANGQLRIGTANDPVVNHLPGQAVISVDGFGRFPKVGLEANHVVFIKSHDDPNDAFDTPDGIAIQLENSVTGLTDKKNNFLTFYNGFGEPVGRIEGFDFPPVGQGVSFVSGGADFAEYLEKIDPADTFQVGEIVGVSGGKVSRQIDGAEHILVITGAPVVLGNAPPPELEHLWERVAFLGQVPTLVLGDVNPGDYILPSGLEDGTGIAVAPEDLNPEDLPLIVGTAWTGVAGDPGGAPGLVTVALGFKAINWGAIIDDKVPDQLVVDDLQREVDGLKQRVAQMEAMLAKITGTPPPSHSPNP